MRPQRAFDILDPSEGSFGDVLALDSTFRRAHELLRGRYSREDLAAIAASIRALAAGASPSIDAVLAWGKRESRRPRATLHGQQDGCAILALLLVGDASLMLDAPLPPLAYFRGNLNDDYRQCAYARYVYVEGNQLREVEEQSPFDRRRGAGGVDLPPLRPVRLSLQRPAASPSRVRAGSDRFGRRLGRAACCLAREDPGTVSARRGVGGLWR